MRLLDLFCGAGGAGMGYSRAGFEVVGVDLSPQPHYPFEFHQADALEYLSAHGHEFDAIHASPPCQKYSYMTNGLWKDTLGSHPALIAPTRELLLEINKPFVIENVSGARTELVNPTLLCGTMFGLGIDKGNQLIRHRYFETNPFFVLAPPCTHNGMRAVGVYGHSGGTSKRDNIGFFSVNQWREAMGIDWMNGDELAEAIPPAYTQYIGLCLLEVLEKERGT